jgi:type IV secretory pathway TrbD component
MERRANRVYRSLHKPLTVLGVERGMLFTVAVLAGAVFNLMGSLLAALVIFAAGYVAARIATHTDSRILTIVFRSERLKTRYDAAMHEPVLVEVKGHVSD